MDFDLHFLAIVNLRMCRLLVLYIYEVEVQLLLPIGSGLLTVGGGGIFTVG